MSDAANTDSIEAPAVNNRLPSKVKPTKSQLASDFEWYRALSNTTHTDKSSHFIESGATAPSTSQDHELPSLLERSTAVTNEDDTAMMDMVMDMDMDVSNTGTVASSMSCDLAVSIVNEESNHSFHSKDEQTANMDVTSPATLPSRSVGIAEKVLPPEMDMPLADDSNCNLDSIGTDSNFSQTMTPNVTDEMDTFGNHDQMLEEVRNMLSSMNEAEFKHQLKELTQSLDIQTPAQFAQPKLELTQNPEGLNNLLDSYTQPNIAQPTTTDENVVNVTNCQLESQKVTAHLEESDGKIKASSSEPVTSSEPVGGIDLDDISYADLIPNLSSEFHALPDVSGSPVKVEGGSGLDIDRSGILVGNSDGTAEVPMLEHLTDNLDQHKQQALLSEINKCVSPVPPVSCMAAVPTADVCPMMKSAKLEATPPQLITVSMFWNELPGLWLEGKEHVRLVDIHKQMLPAKDTGELIMSNLKSWPALTLFPI